MTVDTDITINELAQSSFEIADKHGWWDDEETTDETHVIAARLMLIVTEVAEAMEDVRNGKLDEWVDEGGKPHGFPTELADIIIRTLDLAEWMGIDMDAAITRKEAFNRTREYKHGGKTI